MPLLEPLSIFICVFWLEGASRKSPQQRKFLVSWLVNQYRIADNKDHRRFPARGVPFLMRKSRVIWITFHPNSHLGTIWVLKLVLENLATLGDWLFACQGFISVICAMSTRQNS